ncbi:MAG: aminoacyl-tRNA hydrolase [Planctomycetota bacterium]|nr:MAG: aminoacyl-tRNA hydrolase [Planctomycetota bacterium]
MAREKEIRLGDGAIVIPADALDWQFARSSGPGGQHVNRTSTKAMLRFDARHTTHLPEAVRRRFLALVAPQLTNEGHLIITSQRFRDQPQNIADCLAKLSALLERAVRPPRVRRRTKVPRRAIARRLDGKKRRGATKALRGRPAD